MSFDPNSITVAEAQSLITHSGKEGCECLTCGTYVRVYPRKISASAARFLIAITRLGYDKPFNLPETRAVLGLEGGGKEESRLTAWGLLRRNRHKRSDGAPGFTYTLLDRGRDFARGQVCVPKYALIPGNNTNVALGHDGPMVSIRDALTEKFDFDELMYGP